MMPRLATDHEFYDPAGRGRCHHITGVGHFPEAIPSKCWLTASEHQQPRKSSEDGFGRRAEHRNCAELRCQAVEAIMLDTDDQTEMDAAFRANGWRGDFCPAHAHLARG